MALPSRAALVLLAASPVASLHINPNVGGRSLVHGAKIAAGAPCLTHEVATFDIWADGTLLEAQHERLRAITAYRPGGRCDSMMRLGLEVAFLAHLGQTRKSGEPYITHPVSVAAILADSKLDVESVVSGLLHDTVEDTVVDFGDIQRLFGNDVRKIVEGETKVSKLPKMVRSELASKQVRNMSLDKQDEQMENLRSMFVAMAEDWRIVVVKLADRLHNMRTLEHMPPQKRISIARETLEIFAPLAHRLGMWSFRSELADLSLSYLFPTEFVELEKFIEAKRRDYQATLAAATEELDAGLANDPRLCDAASGESRITVTGRTKNVHSTWKKLHRRGAEVSREELDQVLDLVALRIVVDTGEPGDASDAEDASVCYHVLGRVHQFWTPLPRTLKDYISSPKPNGYASLHTTVLVGTQTLEVQIRTLSMHRVAEHGAAAHWAYKDHGASLPWLQIIRQWHAQVDCAHEFVQLVRDELLGTRVFVFTRNGRILNLAKGATLADAAAQLGTDAGMPGGAFRGRVGEVNGSPAPAGRELANGDIVSFEPPSAERRMLDASGYELTQLQTARRRQQQQPQPPSPPQMQPQPSPPQLQPQPPQPQLQAAEEVVADATDPDDEAPGWAVCAVCKPLPGDELAGTRAASRGGGGAGARTLHRRGCDCRELQKELELESNAAANAADADADDDAVQRELSEALAELRETDAEGAAVGYEAQISVFCEDRRGMMMDVASVCTDVASNIVDVHSETRDGGGAAVFQFTVQLHDAAQLARLVGEMVGVPSVTRVVRSSMKELKRDRSTRAFWALAEPGEGTRSEAP